MINNGESLLQVLELIKAGATTNTPVGEIALGKFELNKKKFIFIKWCKWLFNATIYGIVLYSLLQLFL